jgi:hypothetical protein
MLRSPITPNRTEVQLRPDMKQTTIRRLLPTPTPSGQPAAPLPCSQIARKLTTTVRLFKG